jgi:hypothetical protein
MNRACVIVAAVALLVAGCDEDEPPVGTGECTGPTIYSCSGNPCQYGHIFDYDGNFITETSGGTGNWYWNGTDCNGDRVPCGGYTMVVYLVRDGQTSSTTDQFLVIGDSTTESATREAPCDTLRAACEGTYYEATPQYSHKVCICCK